MKASPRQQQLLLELQDFDHAEARLRRRRVQLPEREQLAAMEGEHRAAKQAFMEVQRELDAQSAEIARLESDVDTVRQRRERDESLLSVSTSPKEAQALQSELETLARRKNELEERELELMEASEQTQQRFDAAAGALANCDTRRSDLEAAIAAAEQEIDAELAQVGEQRAGLAAEVQGDVRELYEGLRARIGIGAARLRGNVSEASNMALTPAELSGINAAAADEIVFCPGTGVILVRGATE